MHLIPTARKEKLPTGFSYPLGAEAISEAFDGVPYLENATLWFDWRDEYRASTWRKKIESRGSVKLLEVGVWPLSDEPLLHVYSVPSDYSSAAREHLLAELPRVRRKLLSGSRTVKPAKIIVALNLSEAKRAANPQGRPNWGQPGRLASRRAAVASASGRSPRSFG